MAREIISALKYRRPLEGFDTHKLSKALEEAYLLQRKESKHVQKYSFSPSSIGYGNGTCPRYWHLSFTGAVRMDTVDALGIANMANGSAAHDRWQKIFEDAEILVAKEVEINLQDPPIRGFLDVMIRWEDDVLIGEIKTARQESYIVRESSMKPSPNHLLQILIYMKATNKKRGFLLYENKNTQEFLIIPVEMNKKNEKILNDALAWMREVWQNFQDGGGLPKRPFTKKSTVCKSCPLWDVCWTELPEGTVDIPAMEVQK